jgi:hypothetical protein
MRRAALVVAIAIAGCGSTYASGSVAHASGAWTRLDCVELAVARSFDRYRPGPPPYDRPVVEVSLGNVCAHPATVHFERLVWTLVSDAGTYALRVSDPRHELRPLALDAYGEAREKLQLEGDLAAWRPAANARLCADVTRFEGGVRLSRGVLCLPYPAEAP